HRLRQRGRAQRSAAGGLRPHQLQVDAARLAGRECRAVPRAGRRGAVAGRHAAHLRALPARAARDVRAFLAHPVAAFLPLLPRARSIRGVARVPRDARARVARSEAGHPVLRAEREESVAMLDLQPAPRTVRRRFAAEDYVELTMHFKCNLKCEHCMIEGTMDWLKPESMEQFDAILAQNAQQGRWKGLVMTGSEVTLRRDLPDLARAARASGFEHVRI